MSRSSTPDPSQRFATPDREEAFLRTLLAAFPDRVALRRPGGASLETRAVMVGGRGVRLADESTVATAELFVCVSVDAGRRGERSESLVRQASALEREWLPASSIRHQVEVDFDDATERIAAWTRTRFRDLILEEKIARVPRREAGERLGEIASSRFRQALDLDSNDVAAWLARVRCLGQWMPELELPAFDDAILAEVARELSVDRQSFEEVRRAPLLDALRSRLTYQQSRALGLHAPERMEVPSGSAVRLDYQPGSPPNLAVRIQEVFGMTETPRVADGRVAVVLHLLAPNRRPAQVTEDLASFWKNTYAEVRKELRARYPKHSWPEDPTRAQPQSRPARRRR